MSYSIRITSNQQWQPETHVHHGADFLPMCDSRHCKQKRQAYCAVIVEMVMNNIRLFLRVVFTFSCLWLWIFVECCPWRGGEPPTPPPPFATRRRALWPPRPASHLLLGTVLDQCISAVWQYRLNRCCDDCSIKKWGGEGWHLLLLFILARALAWICRLFVSPATYAFTG